MAIADDREQPCFRVRASKRLKGSERAQHGVLDDVVRIARGLREPPGEPIGGVQVRQHLRFEATALVIHGRIRRELSLT